MKSYMPGCPGITLQKTSKYGCRQPGLGNTVCTKTNNPIMNFGQHFGLEQFCRPKSVWFDFWSTCINPWYIKCWWYADKHTHTDIARLLVKNWNPYYRFLINHIIIWRHVLWLQLYISIPAVFQWGKFVQSILNDSTCNNGLSLTVIKYLTIHEEDCTSVHNLVWMICNVYISFIFALNWKY